MATYQLISANELTSTTSSVTFSSIPQTYTDLLIKLSVRSSDAGFTNDQLRMRFNGSSSSVYNYTIFRGDGSGAAVAGSSGASDTSIYPGLINADNSKVVTFSNAEIYIPNYANSSYPKQSGAVITMEHDNTTSYITTGAGRYSGTSPISSITFVVPNNGASFKPYSSFYLYGISNA